MATARRIVVTGAAGNLGGKVLQHLREQPDCDPLGIDLAADASAGIVAADLRQPASAWAHHLAGLDTLVHFAADRSPAAPWSSLVPLNLDMMMRVLAAAADAGARRIVFASSNYAVAGHRFSHAPLTAQTEPWPINGYGATKLMGERFGAHLHERTGVSFIALRIGYCQRLPGNRPGPHLNYGRWGHEMWLSDRDLCAGVTCAVRAEGVGFAVLPLVSANAGNRWDLAAAKATIGYVPQDGITPQVPIDRRLKSGLARLLRFQLPSLIERFTSHRW
jgi:hypothetical protein